MEEAFFKGKPVFPFVIFEYHRRRQRVQQFLFLFLLLNLTLFIIHNTVYYFITNSLTIESIVFHPS